MKVIVLPGFSPRNKEWGLSVVSNLPKKLNSQLVEWPHWDSGIESDFSEDDQATKLVEIVGTESVYVIAKSIGTVVTARALPQILSYVEKLILCGIPLSLIKEKGYEDDYKSLSQYPKDKVMVIQNDHDPLGGSGDIQNFFKNLSLSISVISQHRDDHSYPFYSEFNDFLK